MKTYYDKLYMGFFDMGLHIVVTDTLRKWLKRHPKLVGEIKDDFPINGISVCYNGNIILGFNRSPNKKGVYHDIIAHEVRHAVDQAFNARRIKWGPEGCQETAALAAEYFTRNIYHYMKKNRIKLI